MAPRSRLPFAVVCAAAWVLASGLAGASEGPRPNPARALAASSDSLDSGTLLLRRAVAEQRTGNLRGVVLALESLDLRTEPRFEGADRAAFLLGNAYLELGAHDRFARLARAVSGWERKSAYTRWLEVQRLMEETESVIDTSGGVGARGVSDQRLGIAVADALAAQLLLEGGDPAGAVRRASGSAGSGPAAALLGYLEAKALAAAGLDDGEALVRLSTVDSSSVLGRDLGGAAILALATRALERGEDPRALLETVPPGSRYADRALHLRGQIALERGEVDEAQRLLDSLRVRVPSGRDAREAGLALAGIALERSEWESAHAAYQAIDRAWTRERDSLAAHSSATSYEGLWSDWERDPASEFLVLDRASARALSQRLATAASDLGAEPGGSGEDLGVATPGWGKNAWVPPPPPLDWARMAAAERTRAEAHDEVARAREALNGEERGLADHRRYLDVGLDRVREERRLLEERAARLDSLGRALDQLDASLRGVRDEATRHVVERARRVLSVLSKHRLWIAGMRRFYIDGPLPLRPTPMPAGIPRPESLLVEEEKLAAALEAALRRLEADAPGLIARSYERAWRPGLIDRVRDQGAEAARSLAWARALEGGVDSSIAAASTSDAVRELQARIARLERASDSLDTRVLDLRTEIARAAIERALAGLEVEREGIDYGLAVSAYGRAVLLGAAGDRGAVAARHGADAAQLDSLASSAEDDPETAAWRERAALALESFLAAHDSSAARGEIRFRLADLVLVQARQDFREHMAHFVEAQAEGRPSGALPLLDSDAALALYRKILAEDPDFSRRDAVLFNAAMIMADAGDAEADGLFAELTRDFPQSPYVQESNLRMGDLRFNAKRFAECLDLYQRAAAGPDPSLAAVALYKLGWAHFNQERYADAADAFRSVLDLYAAGNEVGIQMDLESEAEAYLVHALARAGGAKAFGEHFDRVGERPFSQRVLMQLGQHFRRFSLFGEAVAVDELYLDRYPSHADALVAARRLIETRQRAAQEDAVRDARRRHAPHFAPRGAWFEAQASDSVKEAGAEFARSSWMALAIHHHEAAREHGAPADWRAAREYYRTVLSYWPDDAEAPTLHLHAGEASAELDEYPAALEHYGTAASGPDSVASIALWQRVAVTDVWYQSTRSKPGGGGLGSESLAQAVLEAADRLLERFPEHPESADLHWRQGNLAFAHGWFERATEDLGTMTVRHPADARTPLAAGIRADAFFRLERYEDAGQAYEQALALARDAGYDSLEAHAATAVPICYHRQAEAAVAADSTDYKRHAELFERIAARFPRYEHAHATQYRAGLAFRKAQLPRDAVRSWRGLIRTYPKSEYVRDAHLQIAAAWIEAGEESEGAQAYVDFVTEYPDDPSAREAWLKAADLFAADGKEPRAEELRLQYLRAYPDDFETAAEILEPLARRDLTRAGPGSPISAFLGDSTQSRKGSHASRGPEAPPSHLAAYLRLVAAHPKLASQALIAEVRFLEGEEAFEAYSLLELKLPLDRSLGAKQKALDRVLLQYRRCVEQGVATFAHASTFRIGEALVGFGEALERSEVPADLEGDDSRAYENVLMDKAQVFYDRAEGVWTDLLRKKGSEAATDPWIAKAQTALWHRLGDRFYGKPELEFPLVAAATPHKLKGDAPRPERAETPSHPDSSSTGAEERPR